MTIAVKIEIGTGKQSISAKLPALPRKGDGITCTLPSSGISRLVLRVTGVFFHQIDEQPPSQEAEFRVVVTADSDPDHVDHNVSLLNKAAGL